MKLSVVYSSDDNYAQHVGVSIISLLDNNKHFTDIDIYIIDNDISVESKEKLNIIIKNYNRKVKYINFSMYKSQLKLNMEWDISLTAYARLFISSMLPESIEKVLYFDCDTVIVDKLDEVWSIDIDKYYIAGVQDTVSNKTKIAVGINENYKYINSGMLLINLKKWREDKIEKKFMNFINKYNGNVIHHDQGVINGVLYRNMKIISPKFNLMTIYYTMSRDEIIEYYGISGEFYSQNEIDEAINNVVYIHYTPGFTTRPWVKGCKHPKKYIYLKYLYKTPWSGIKLEKDKSKIKVKVINWIYSTFSFNKANKICNIIMKLKIN